MIDDVTGAIADLSAAIELYSQTSESHTRRGQAYRSRGALDVAVAEFDAARNVDAQSGLAYYDRSLAHTARHDNSAAAQDLHRAIQLNPKIVRDALGHRSQK